MARIVKITICLLFVLTQVAFGGCSSTNKSNSNIFYDDNYIFDQDDQYYFSKELVINHAMAESEEGYYFFSGVNNSYLYFMDKKGMKAQILCNKPECLHADEPNPEKKSLCNALFLASNNNLIYYDKKLYVLRHDIAGSGFILYQVSLDGLNRKQIYAFKVTPTCMIIHRGYIYFSSADITTMDDVNNSTETKTELFRLSLSNPNGKPELLYRNNAIHACIYKLVGYKNSVYFSYVYYNDKKLESYNSTLMKYDVFNSRIGEVKKNAAYYALCGDYIVYLWDGKYNRCNLDGSNSIALDHLIGGPMNCEEYILSDTVNNEYDAGTNNRELIINNFNGEKISAINIDMGVQVYGSDGNYIFFSDTSQKNEFGRIISLYAIDIKDIGKELPKPRKLHEFIPTVEDKGVITSLNP